MIKELVKMERIPKVSIIVPIYNVERYLKQCLDSCVKQTLKDIEIICVDDGSTDRSYEIVKQYARRDKRIIPVTKKNAGYGNSMNIGLERANGEYIGIVESDDYVERDMFETLYKTAKKYEVDVVKSDYMTFQTIGGKEKTAYDATCIEPGYYNKVLIPSRNKVIFTFQMNTWTGIYRTQFLRDNNIRHNETPGAAYQDNGFWFQTLTLARTVMFVNKAFYHYRQDNPNSSINSKGKVFCMNYEYAFIHSFIKAHPEVEKNFMYEYFRKMFFNYMHTYERIAEQYKLEYLKRFSSELREAQQAKEIDLAKIPDNWIASMALRISDDYKRFYYEDTIWKLKRRFENAQERLEMVKTSNEMLVGRKNADRILKILKRDRL